jgi:hypothetical protein
MSCVKTSASHRLKSTHFIVCECYLKLLKNILGQNIKYGSRSNFMPYVEGMVSDIENTEHSKIIRVIL